MSARFYLSLLLATCVACLTGCPKKKYQPSPSDTVMGSGYTQRPDYVVGSDAYQSELADQGLVQRADSMSSSDLAANSQAHALVSVFFQFDNSTISGQERPKLAEAAKHLQTNPNARFLVVGHCDYHGTAEYNMALGEQRAKSVANYLQQIGCDSQRVEVVSRGDLDASARTGTPAETAKDRRGDVVVLQ